MTRGVIAVDIDHTIHDPSDLYDEACQKLHKCDFYFNGHKEYLSHEALVNRFGEKYYEIFNEALHEKNFHRREIYPGAIEMVNWMQDEGFHVQFLTFNRLPKFKVSATKWLKDHFGPDVDVTVTATGNKVAALHKLDANVLIDDAPKYLEPAMNAGFPVIVRKHPWNHDFLEENPDIPHFTHWKRVKTIMEEKNFFRSLQVV